MSSVSDRVGALYPEGEKLKNREKGWVGFDLDRTLAHYDHYRDDYIGPPIRPMLERLKRMLEEGYDCRIFTARISHDNSAERILQAQRHMLAICDWCVRHVGRMLPITCTKDFTMWMIFDDRAVGIWPNTGERCDGLTHDQLPATSAQKQSEIADPIL